MNKDGHIKEFGSQKEAELAGYRHALTPSEYQEMHNVPADQRVRHVALSRFMKAGGRNTLPDNVREKVENAFNMGWKASREQG